jgi:hypothetical protein
MNLINISNHPLDNTITRKACRAGIQTDEHRPSDQKYVDLNVLVKHFKNGVEYDLIPDYIFTLKAINDTLVDPATGEYVDSSFEGAMGEADFFIEVIAANQISIDSMSTQSIQRADIYERFNNYSSARIVTWM